MPISREWCTVSKERTSRPRYGYLGFVNSAVSPSLGVGSPCPGRGVGSPRRLVEGGGPQVAHGLTPPPKKKKQQ